MRMTEAFCFELQLVSAAAGRHLFLLGNNKEVTLVEFWSKAVGAEYSRPLGYPKAVVAEKGYVLARVPLKSILLHIGPSHSTGG
jgi:hypothetical protein